MTGFFKKLFNRISGQKDEAAPPPLPEVEALPPPEPELPATAHAEPTPAEPAPEPVEIERAEAEAVIEPLPAVVEETQPVEAEKPEPKKPEPRPKRAKKPAEEKIAPIEEPVENPPAETEARSPVETEIEPEPAAEIVSAPEIPAARAPEPPIVAEDVTEPGPPPPQPRGGWFTRLKDGLAKSSRSLTGSITAIFTKRKLDAETLEELEDVLIQADLGVEMTTRIVKAVSAGRYDKEIEPEEVKAILAGEVAKVLKPVEVPFNFGSEKPFVVLVVGVNGSGKTTTIGKLGAIATGEGYSVMLAACDTFRAAAIEQLAVWGKRIGARVISRPTGADAAGLAFDAMKEAKAAAADILIIDTAGRLQNKTNLMAELDKIVRVIKKQDETAPHAVLLVLDATTGQNAVSQADVFTKVAGVTGLIMTKLDGTARGGILVAIAERFKLPIHAIGVGEQIEDLQPFDAEAFSRAIAGLEE